MTSIAGDGKLARLYNALRAGEITRREFVQRAVALGVAMPVLTFIINSLNMKGVAAQEAPAGRPLAPEGLERGAGGEIRLLQHQTVTTLSLHHASGTKDQLAASLVTEPLMSYLPDGTVIPNLVKEVPSIENGGLAEDLTSVTYNLLEGVVWSDGTPFTAHDVVATLEAINNPEFGANTVGSFEIIAAAEALDDLTVKFTFQAPTLIWYIPFTGTYWGAVMPKHILDLGVEEARFALGNTPIGTGPYKVDTFLPDDQVIYSINENYREPNKPYFSSVNLAGIADAASAARAVLETGDWDLAWNLQVEPQIIQSMVESGGQGQWIVEPGTSMERILINFSDPWTEVNGQRSEMNTPHPFLSDLAVRQAINLAADRETLSTQFYAGPPGEPPAGNALVGMPTYESPNTTWEFNLEKAAQILDDAGWVLDGNVRRKDGVALEMVYVSPINPVRQRTQQVLKQGLEQIGFSVELREVAAGIFFDSGVGNDQNYAHFYSDIQMYTNNVTTPFPLVYFLSWYGGPDRSNIAQSPNWSGVNESRWWSEEYDTLFESLGSELDPERAAETFIRLNDIVIEEVVIVPLVQRAAETIGVHNRIGTDTIAGSSWEALYWNAANWYAVQE